MGFSFALGMRKSIASLLVNGQVCEKQNRDEIMKRIELGARSNLDALAEEAGFDFHVIDGDRYWDETRAYSFTLRQIEDDIEDPTQEIHGMLLSIEQRRKSRGMEFRM